MLAGIEAGGTKFVCGVGDASGSRAQTVIPTLDPVATLDAVEAFLRSASHRHGAIEAIGIGSFGPLELDPESPAFGRITTTPKPGWSGVNLAQIFGERFDVPVAIDVDVNAAALAEARQREVASLAYVTVGTGIGVGLVIDGRTQKGFGHPEAGHVPIARHAAHGEFGGICPYHGACLEGLASGPAIKAAWGASLADLPFEHPAWEIQASYLGRLCATLVLTVAPDRIVLGGGVMQQARLLPMVRVAMLQTLGGYCSRWDEAAADHRIVPPACSEAPGLVGAYLLAAGLA